MIKISFKVMAISIAVMTLVSALYAAATTRALPAAASGVDLSSETRTVDGFGDELSRFEFACQDLAKKQSLTALDLNSARNAATWAWDHTPIFRSLRRARWRQNTASNATAGQIPSRQR